MKVNAEGGCAHCASRTRDASENNTVPGARFWETPGETEERKWISYLIRQRSKALTAMERRVLSMLFALEENSRRSECRAVASSLSLRSRDEVHEIAREALAKICYTSKVSRRRRAASK